MRQASNDICTFAATVPAAQWDELFLFLFFFFFVFGGWCGGVFISVLFAVRDGQVKALSPFAAFPRKNTPLICICLQVLAKKKNEIKKYRVF